MANVAIVESGVVVYRGSLPKNWKNTSGLHNSKDDWDALAELGIYPLEEVTPSVDSDTEILDGWTEDIQADKVVLTHTKRSLTSDELADIAASEAVAYKWKRESEYPEISDQLDMLWHAIDTGDWTAAKVKLTSFYTELKAVKDKYPKE
ncbi:MAG: hypothetical protein QF535_21035 [Anaerolineales bacterium]|nr:hypothetical protein [Anaerolineales bacterium]